MRQIESTLLSFNSGILRYDQVSCIFGWYFYFLVSGTKCFYFWWGDLTTVAPALMSHWHSSPITVYLHSVPRVLTAACLCWNQTRSQVHFSPEATKPVVGNNQMLATGNPVHYCHLPLSLLQQNEISIFFSFLPLLNHRTRDLGNKGDMNAWNGDLSWDNNQKTFLVTLPWTTDEALTKSGRGSFKAWAGWTDR